jgi:hypothetical protein
MAIRNAAERKSLANKYAADNPFGTLFSADPGTAGNATNELSGSGGSPVFARKALSWSAPVTTGVTEVITATATFDIQAGVAVAYAGVAASGTLATNDIKDSVAAVYNSQPTQGTATVTFTYTQS